VQREEQRLPTHDPHRLRDFRKILKAAEADRDEALNAYLNHLLKHGCGRPTDIPSLGGNHGVAR
jgi:hypothetical protein